MLILEGKSYKNYWEENVKGKHSTFFNYADGPKNFKELMEIGDPTATETTVGNYTDWLIRELKKELKKTPMGKYRNSDLVKSIMLLIGNYLKYFHNNKGYFDKQDIFKYDFRELRDECSIVEDKKSTMKLKGFKPDFEFNGWKIINIKNHQQACNIGSGSRWCITGKDYPNEFSKYRKFGPIFFIVKDNNKWAITGGVSNSYHVWDAKDKHITVYDWKKDNNVPEEVFNYIRGRYKNES